MITANFEAMRPADTSENLSLAILRALVEEPYQTLEGIRAEAPMDERVLRRHLFYLQEAGLVTAIQYPYDLPRFHATDEGRKRIRDIDARMACACEQPTAGFSWASLCIVCIGLLVLAISSC